MDRQLKKIKRTLGISDGALIAIAVILFAVMVLTANGIARSYLRQLDLGRKYYLELQYDKAILAYEKAINIEPRSLVAYEELAQIYIDQDDYESAIAVMDYAAEHVGGEDRDLVAAHLEEYERKAANPVSEVTAGEITGTPEPEPEPEREPEPESEQEPDFGVVLKAQDDEKKGSDADELLDKFIAGEIPAQDETDEFYVGDLADSWAEYTVGGRLDLDNDGENELIIEGHSGTSMYLDASDGKVRVFTRGGGMSNVLSHLSYDGAEWIVHSDTSHAGRKMYFLEKYNGADTVVDSFDLNAEYWNSSTDTYDENSTFTYRGKQITMEEYEKLIKEIFG